MTKTVINKESYTQPDHSLPERALQSNADFSNIEMIHYVKDSHARIWYNVQTDDYPLHQHDALEIVLCMRNSYKVIVNGKSFLMNEGDILFIPPYTAHELICVEDGSRFIFLFDIDFLSALHDFQTMGSIMREPFFCNRQTHPAIFDEISGRFQSIVDLYFIADPFWEASVFSNLIEVFSLFGKNGGLPAASIEPVNQNQNRYGRISAALYYIDNNFTEDITLEQVADYIGFSKYHFSRLFKKETGKTFYDYVCLKRIQSAESLLATADSITSVAFQSGFNNITTFNRCFKKFTGLTPSEYRKKSIKTNILPKPKK